MTHEILLTNNSAGDGPGGDVNALLHERSQGKPEAVDHAEVVAHLKRMFFSVSNSVQKSKVPLFLTLTPQSAIRMEKT